MDKWEQIKNTYIVGDMGVRPLSAQFGISYDSLQKRATREKWADLRRQHRKKVAAKISDERAKSEAEQFCSVLAAAKTLSEKLCEVAQAVDTADLAVKDIRSLRSLTAAMKDLADIQGIKSEADAREQEARIKQMERTPMTLDDKYEWLVQHGYIK